MAAAGAPVVQHRWETMPSRDVVQFLLTARIHGFLVQVEAYFGTQHPPPGPDCGGAERARRPHGSRSRVTPHWDRFGAAGWFVAVTESVSFCASGVFALAGLVWLVERVFGTVPGSWHGGPGLPILRGMGERRLGRGAFLSVVGAGGAGLLLGGRVTEALRGPLADAGSVVPSAIKEVFPSGWRIYAINPPWPSFHPRPTGSRSAAW